MTNPFKALLLALVFAGVALIAPSAARADTVTPGTTRSFNGSPSTLNNGIVFSNGIGNALTLTFRGIPAGASDANSVTFASSGSITTNTTGTGATITPGTTFTLTINQTLPGVGSGNLPATLSGTIAPNSSTGVTTFSVTTVTINGIRYDIVNNPLALVPASTGGGVTTIPGQVTASIPEPASLLLLGTSLLGIAGAVRRRLKGPKQV